MNNSKEVINKTTQNAMQQQVGAKEFLGLEKSQAAVSTPGFQIIIEHKTLGTLEKKCYSREQIVQFFSNFDMDNIWGVNIHPIV